MNPLNCRRTPCPAWAVFHAAATALLVLSLTACGTLKARAEAVQITATASEVVKCERTGIVLLSTYESEFGQRQRELKFETARMGGNVLLVNSYATATTGTAYNCVQPIDARRVAS